MTLAVLGAVPPAVAVEGGNAMRTILWGVVVGIVVVLGACSSSNDTTTTGAGGSTGGAAGSTGGAAGSTVPADGAAGSTGDATGSTGGAQGAVSIDFVNPDPPITALCNVQHQATAPILTAGNVPTSNANTGTIAFNGENGAVVSCTVTPGGGGYNVTATIHSELGAKHVDISISSLTIADGQSDVAGMLTINDDTTQNPYFSSTTDPCKFSVSGGSLGIAPGKIWGSVACPTLADPENIGGDQCKVTGYFIFENCAQ
jgi:hypothetical protein